MKQALRGVNLGGWLVVEYWMSPQLFDGVQGRDEIALVRELGEAEARRRLTLHRGTFITEDDFKHIRQCGFDFVRLPVGHWLFTKTEDFIDGEEYVERAFMWAKKHGLKVILDFHGLQGSQNGKDHSGIIGPVRAFRPSNATESIQTTLYMAKKFGRHPALLALEVINEPAQRFFLGRLVRYYDRLVPQLRSVLPARVKIVVSDAFWPRRMARVLGRRGYKGVVLDVHLYQNNPPFWRRRFEDFMSHVSFWRKLLKQVDKHIPVMVGEWSAALPTRVLDAEQGSTHKELERRYYQAQLRVYDEVSWAHCYWNYKAPHNGPWDYVWARQWLESAD